MSLTVKAPEPISLLTIYGEKGQLLVDIKPGEELEFGEDYTPDEAARIFWEAVAKAAP